MKVIIQDTAHDSIKEIFEYLMIYSSKNAMNVIDRLYLMINNLKYTPYLGRCIPEIHDVAYRELIYRRYQNSYRIMYYISKKTNTIYIIYVANCKRNFNKILKLYNYFSKF